jgi:HEAT repeat protein
LRQTEFVESLERRPSRRFDAAQEALIILGPEISLQPILKILGDRQAPTMSRFAITEAIVEMTSRKDSRSALVPAVPVLAACAVESKGSMAILCIRALGTLALQPEVSVPALTHVAQYLDPGMRVMALSSLSCFGTNAAPSLPILIKALTDTNASVRKAATNAIERIAPQEAHLTF